MAAVRSGTLTFRKPGIILVRNDMCQALHTWAYYEATKRVGLFVSRLRREWGNPR